MPRPLPLPRQWLLDQAFVLYLTSQALDPTTVCLQERPHMLRVKMEPGTCVHSFAWKG